ncbi:MAG: B-box zinc finger protein [Acidobacteriia bacterium]|nr:B-box zinc finger protein [Terriglobia bacterium]
MKCANHPLNDAFAYCGQCGRSICNDCKREVGGMVYCESCLAARLRTFPPPLVGAGPSPGVALGLGFIPGVGAIYNGQILKAMVQVLIFGSLIALGDRVHGPLDTIFGLGAAAFYFYMVIDSYQTAKAKQLGKPAPEWFGLGDMKMNVPIGAALLIGLGALFLLDNFGVPVFSQIGKFWPVLLIVVGFLLLQRRLSGHKPETPVGPANPEKPSEGPSNIPGPRGL